MRIAEATGLHAVRLARERIGIDRIMTPQALENGLRVMLAIGGSTNALVHLTAVAGRLGLKVDLDALDRMSDDTPVLVDLKPSGDHYMEDFHRAGGMPRLLQELRPLLHLDVPTVSGRTLREQLDDAPRPFAQDVIRPLAHPIHPVGALSIVKGNLAPGGAVIKRSAASAALMEHEGRAIVFEDAEDLARRLDDPELDVRPADVLVLRNIGPRGAPGMPEAGYIPIPRKLARQGVKDMVRISDGRMSGTAFGTIVLHVTPESAVGGPLALVRTGDRIRLSVARRELTLLVGEAELARRLDREPPPAAHLPQRGYRKLYLERVTQADQGADFDFLQSTQVHGSVPCTNPRES
jgi:dihydroxy-acid dehydratase